MKILLNLDVFGDKFKKWTSLNCLQCILDVSAVREQKNQSCMSNKPSMWHQVITNPIEIPFGGIAKSKTGWNIWNNWLLVGYLFLGSVSFWKPFKKWRILLDNCKCLNPKLLHLKKISRNRSKERMVAFTIPRKKIFIWTQEKFPSLKWY